MCPLTVNDRGSLVTEGRIAFCDQLMVNERVLVSEGETSV